jgi:hypothetical protein
VNVSIKAIIARKTTFYKLEAGFGMSRGRSFFQIRPLSKAKLATSGKPETTRNRSMA